jgi:hypothetical protein
MGQETGPKAVEDAVFFILRSQQEHGCLTIDIQYPAPLLEIQDCIEYRCIALAISIYRISRLELDPAMIVRAVPILKIVDQDVPLCETYRWNVKGLATPCRIVPNWGNSKIYLSNGC